MNPTHHASTPAFTIFPDTRTDEQKAADHAADLAARKALSSSMPPAALHEHIAALPHATLAGIVQGIASEWWEIEGDDGQPVLDFDKELDSQTLAVVTEILCAEDICPPQP